MNRNYHVVTYDSESVIYDKENKKIVGCPTEQEAEEYIAELDAGHPVFYKEAKNVRGENGDS